MNRTHGAEVPEVLVLRFWLLALLLRGCLVAGVVLPWMMQLPVLIARYEFLQSGRFAGLSDKWSLQKLLR
jgi:hypothetical protein